MAKDSASKKAYQRAYYLAHREKKIAAAIARIKERANDPVLAEEDREIQRASGRRWAANHPEEAKAMQAAYRAANPAKINARRRARYAENPEKPLANNRKRDALRRGAKQSDLTTTQWEAIKKHYGYRCVYCGTKTQRLTQDHITPLSAGGFDTLTNVVPACRSCNAKKGTGAVLKPIQPLLLI